MEAMAMGLPILSTRHSGIPEVVPDQEAGFLVEENDVENLAEKMRYLLKNSHEWPKMGRAGRKKAEAEFSIDVLRKKLMQHYKDATQEYHN